MSAKILESGMPLVDSLPFELGSEWSVYLTKSQAEAPLGSRGDPIFLPDTGQKGWIRMERQTLRFVWTGDSWMRDREDIDLTRYLVGHNLDEILLYTFGATGG